MRSLTPCFGGHVDDHGHLTVHNQESLKAWLRRCAGKPVRVSISPGKPQRSGRQNRYFWGVVVKILADELGYTSDELHEALKFKFLRFEAEPEKGRILETVRSTTSLKTDEFEDYLDRIRTWAASELGIIIPLPNEVLDEGVGPW